MIFYAAASKDEMNVRDSSSGGIFFELCKEIINREGTVYGAVQLTPTKVMHERAISLDEIKKFRKSKYIRSEISSYTPVKNDLEKGKWVLFSGTGCQINGLYVFLNDKKYDRLLTVEVVCHGVPLKRAYDKYIELSEQKHNSRMESINFRDKQFGWEKNAICETYEDGSQEICMSSKHMHHSLYLKGINMERGCGSCKFAQLPRIADITLADFWANKGEFIPTGRKFGISLIVASTNKGEEYVESIKDRFYIKRVQREEAVSSCRHLTHAPILHYNQKAFKQLIEYVDFKIASELCTRFGMVCTVSELCILRDTSVMQISEILYRNGQEIVYIEDESNHINGIVTLGSFIDANVNNKPFINSEFRKIYINDDEIITRIEEIFSSNEKILRIPIMDGQDKIIFEVRRNNVDNYNDDPRRWILPIIMMKNEHIKMFYFRRPDRKEKFSYSDAQKKRIQEHLSFPVMASHIDIYADMLKGIMHNRYKEDYIEDLMDVSAIIKKGNRYCHIDQCNKLISIVDGKRVVCSQPDTFGYTIHIYGRCGVFGYAVKDSENIPSQLQKKVKNNGVKVINHGTWGAKDDFIFDNLFEDLVDGTINDNDMVLFYMGNMPFSDIIERLGVYFNDTTNIFHEALKDGKVDFYDTPGHMNAEGYSVIGDYIYKTLESDIQVQCIKAGNKLKNNDSENKKQMSIEVKEIEDYISLQSKVIPVNKLRGKKVGSAVMNCNPFTKGHRHLIETAAAREDYFIVFVVEEDKSEFSFADRLEMVKLGTQDLKNVFVIPSGKYVLSTYTMPEYFYKSQEKAKVIDMSKDLEIFGDYIAPAFNIKRRYVGEEPFDNITDIYNKEQRRYLEKKGIEVIEIKRLSVDGVIISASEARKMLDNYNSVGLNSFLPKTTLEYIDENRPKMRKNRTEKIFGNNNTLICNGASLDGCTINWRGENSIVEIGCDFQASGLTIDIYSGVHISIGDRVEIHKSKWSFGDKSTCIIGDDFSWGLYSDEVDWDDGSEMYVRTNGNVVIGNATHFNKTDLLIVYKDSLLRVGEGVLFARHVTIRTGDGHPIFDKESGKQINETSGVVEIGNDVWLTENVKILGSTNIGEGSVIGANSLIKGEVPAHCVYAGIAGNARVIRENIEWRR